MNEIIWLPQIYCVHPTDAHFGRFSKINFSNKSWFFSPKNFKGSLAISYLSFCINNWKSFSTVPESIECSSDRFFNFVTGPSECLRQKHQFMNFWGNTLWRNYGKQAKSKWERRVSNRWNPIRRKGVTDNGWESRFLNFEI